MRRTFLCIAVFTLLGASWPEEARQAEKAMTADGMLATIRVLASDEYEGRGPGTPGEEKTVAYLTDQIKKIGLKPGNPDGTYVQNVALWGVRSQGEMTVPGIELKALTDYLVSSLRPEAQIRIDKSSIVFAGYGVTAPKQKWDDYAGVDVRGKTVVLLAGDPFGGALSVYGRSYTKLDNAWSKGAAAVLTVQIPRNGRAATVGIVRENMNLRDAKSTQRVAVQGTISLATARQLFPNFDALREAAAKPGFKAVPSAKTASFRLKNEVREINSKNVIAKVQGTDASRFVIYSGHWDHLGREGNDIYHGASDNASGTAGVLELAKGFAKLKPRATIVFLWPTAEEKGLLGAKWYVEHPLYPLAQTLANINLDYFSNWGWGKTKDFSILGLGGSSLEDDAAEVLKRQGRVLTGDTAPAEGFYFRSDHYEFAKGGVVAMEMSPGIDYVGKPESWGAQKREEYIRNDYHKTSDQIKPDWDLSGAIQDLDVLLEVGYKVSQSDDRPRWKRPQDELLTFPDGNGK